MDELPDIDSVDQYTGIFVTGSHCSANESQRWIQKESDWLRAFAQRPTTCKLVASCFGCQVHIPACLITGVYSMYRSVTVLTYCGHNACSFWHQAWEEQSVRIHLGNLC